MLDLKPYLGVTRAPFLLLSVTLVALGAAAGAREGTFSPARSWWRWSASWRFTWP